MRAAALLIAAAACTKSSAPDPTPAQIAAARALPAAIAGDAATVVTANNQLAFDLYAELPAAQNAFFSPFSIGTALSMLEAGAAGNTDAQLRAALHETLPVDQQGSAFGALLTSLDTGRGYGNYTLATADRAFGQDGFAFLQSYLDVTKNDYGAPLQPIDFLGDPDAARTTIDQWVASQTDNKITDLFPEGSIMDDTVLVLANAIVFKGSWAQQFDPSETTTGTFHVAGGAGVAPQMMNATETVTLGSVDGGTLGLLPFAGSDLAMVVIVPSDPDGLPDVEASLTSASLAAAIASAEPTPNTIVELPKLQLDEAYDLKAILQSLGIVDAFIAPPAQPSADFSGIDGGQDMWVQEVFHDATLTVDEQGAEATAATGISVGGGGAGTALPPPELIADHSFLLLIYDNVTKSILFMGRIQDPTKPS